MYKLEKLIFTRRQIYYIISTAAAATIRQHTSHKPRVVVFTEESRSSQRPTAIARVHECRGSHESKSEQRAKRVLCGDRDLLLVGLGGHGVCLSLDETHLRSVVTVLLEVFPELLTRRQPRERKRTEPHEEDEAHLAVLVLHAIMVDGTDEEECDDSTEDREACVCETE